MKLLVQPFKDKLKTLENKFDSLNKQMTLCIKKQSNSIISSNTRNSMAIDSHLNPSNLLHRKVDTNVKPKKFRIGSAGSTLQVDNALRNPLQRNTTVTPTQSGFDNRYFTSIHFHIARKRRNQSKWNSPITETLH
jgi:hypothetical protein